MYNPSCGVVISFGRGWFSKEQMKATENESNQSDLPREVSAGGEFLINPIMDLNYDLKSLRTSVNKSEIDTCVSPAYIVLQGKIGTSIEAT